MAMFVDRELSEIKDNGNGVKVNGIGLKDDGNSLDTVNDNGFLLNVND